MNRRGHLEDVQLPQNPPSSSATIVTGILAVYAIHQLLVYFDFAILSPQELLWNALVYAAPARLLLDAEKRRELKANNMLSQMHAAKSEAMRKMLRLGGGSLSHKATGGEGIMRRVSLFNSGEDAQPTTDAPPGLGNWDNSCYQNSVLQGLSSLHSLKTYMAWLASKVEDPDSTNASLYETVGKLNSASNNGRQLWTPAKLKSMSSWQQQDAQEYFSKIMDELDKEASKAVQSEKEKAGLETIAESQAHAESEKKVEELLDRVSRNPMEGLLAQRVACTRCGFSEGLSMIPFNCLTVPLGSAMSYDLSECLNDYTNLEEISEVDCAKCTLLRSEGQLRQMLPETDTPEPVTTTTILDDNTKKTLGLPPELRVLAAKRLEAIERALEEGDFSDKTLNEACQIPKKAHVSSTKTRQAIVGRAPQSLVVHVNRSVFDEITGDQRKNHASVRYPAVLNLGAWMMQGECNRGPKESLLQGAGSDPATAYALKAVVTHYGRHENGHYICYRKHPALKTTEVAEGGDGEVKEQPAEKWWRLSDEDVSVVSEETVLAQGGVFMLFYEREQLVKKPSSPEPVAAGVKLSADQSMLTAPAEYNEAIEATATEPQPAGNIDDAEAVRIDHDSRPNITPPNGVIEEAPGTMPQPSTPATTTSGSDSSSEVERPVSTSPSAQKPPTPPLMRTSHRRKASRQSSRSDSGFGHAFRPMAAT